jgi:hypothetical protein
MLTDCSVHIDEALRIFRERKIFRPELARATFLKSKILEACSDADEARMLQGKSFQMYAELRRGAMPGTGEPSQAEFDNLVAFWSR